MSAAGLDSAFTRKLGHGASAAALLVAAAALMLGGAAPARAALPAEQSPTPVAGAVPARAALPAEQSPTPVAAAAADQERGSADRPAQAGYAPRPFDHGRHERLFCRDCHGTGDRHRTLLVRTAMDCARCHHDPNRAGTCRDCHAVPPEPGTVAVSLKFTVVDTARTRDLPFRHARHENVECRNCHDTPVTLAPKRECASCHTDHHRAEANCSGCHSTINRVVHPRHSHMSCAGSGCHAPAVAPKPALSRNLCLTCHPEQRNHEPQGSCAACHGIPLNEQ